MLQIEEGVMVDSYISCLRDQVDGGSEPWRRSIVLDNEFELSVRCSGEKSRIGL